MEEQIRFIIGENLKRDVRYFLKLRGGVWDN
jgi:hypothetical protein